MYIFRLIKQFHSQIAKRHIFVKGDIAITKVQVSDQPSVHRKLYTPPFPRRLQNGRPRLGVASQLASINAESTARKRTIEDRR